MRLNRKSRRAQRNTRRPQAGQTPAQQMQAFLAAPGKFHIVQLPDQKSFVVKVTDAEMPIFLTICQQLRGVLGHCEAIPATPVEASVADVNQIAQSSAESTKRIREARARQAKPELHVVKDDPEIDAAMNRHPAGKRSGRHRAPDTETTLDALMATGPTDPTEAAKRAAAMEIAAAQQQAAIAADAMEEANQRLRDAYANGGELHNRTVLDNWAKRAEQTIAEQAEPTESNNASRSSTPNVAIREWCCHTPLTGPHVAGCAYEPQPHEPLDYTAPVNVIDTARQDAINNALRQANNEGTTDAGH